LLFVAKWQFQKLLNEITWANVVINMPIALFSKSPSGKNKQSIPSGNNSEYKRKTNRIQAPTRCHTKIVLTIDEQRSILSLDKPAQSSHTNAPQHQHLDHCTHADELACWRHA
jgi:hypothetical protein